MAFVAGGLGDGMDCLHVVHGHDPAQGIGGQLLKERPGQALVPGEEFLELSRVRKGAAVRQLARGVHRRVVAHAALHPLGDTPAADGIEVFKRKAKRVDLGVARDAVGVGGMRLKFGPDGGLRLVTHDRLQRVDVRRWRWWRVSEDRLGHPRAPVHRPMPCTIGCQREDRSVGQHPATPGFRAKRYARQSVWMRPGQAVVDGQARVEHRPAGINRLTQRQVFVE